MSLVSFTTQMALSSVSEMVKTSITVSLPIFAPLELNISSTSSGASVATIEKNTGVFFIGSRDKLGDSDSAYTEIDIIFTQSTVC